MRRRPPRPASVADRADRSGSSADSAGSASESADLIWSRGAIRWLAAPVGDPANAIYGTVLAAAVISAEDPEHAQIHDMVATVAVTAVVFWLSHGYAQLIGDRFTGTALSLREAGAALAGHWPMVHAAVLPILALWIAAAQGATVDDAQEAALWTTTAMLGLWGAVAGRACHLRGWRLVLYTGGSATLGLAMITLEVVIH